jgi:hypothetical protein
MTYGVNPTGFTIKTLREIIAENNSKTWGYYPAMNVNPPAAMGTFISLFADGISDLWELGQDLYNIFDPDTATGVALDKLGSLKNLTRLNATYSTVTLKFSGTVGTVIPAGTGVSVSNNETTIYQTNDSITITSGDPNPEVIATCTLTGEINANAGTLTIMVNPIAGVSGVTNPDDAAVGRDIESDAEFRVRINTVGSDVNKVTEYGIEQGILELNSDETAPTITDAYVIENDTDEAVGGRLPHSVELFVRLAGADQTVRDQAIAEQLWRIKGAGIQLCGTVDVPIIDYKGI